MMNADDDGLEPDEATTGLWDGDHGRARLEARLVARRLVARQFVSDVTETGQTVSDWRMLLQNEDEVRSILSNLLLELRTDKTYRVAWAVEVEDVDVPRSPAIKRQLHPSVDVTLAVLKLREQVMVYEAREREQARWWITNDELWSEFLRFPQHSSERQPKASARQNAYSNMVRKLQEYGYIVGVDTGASRAGGGVRLWRITPAVCVAMTVERMQALTRAFRDGTATAEAPGDDADGEETDGGDAVEAGDGAVRSQTTIFDYLDDETEDGR